MSDNLKQCPFCGSEAYLQKRKPDSNEIGIYPDKYGDGFLYDVFCSHHDCRLTRDLIASGGYYSPEVAIKTWNTRNEPVNIIPKLTMSGPIVCDKEKIGNRRGENDVSKD